LHILDEDKPAVQIVGVRLELEYMRALQGADPAPEIPVTHLHGHAVGSPAVNDPRELSATTQATGVTLVADLPRLYRNFYRFQNLNLLPKC
jgi:hypothetical protein